MKLDSLSPEQRRVMLAEAAAEKPMFYLMKRGYYYRPEGHGYTSSPSEAWRLSEAEADLLVYPYDEPVTKHPVPLPDFDTDLNACHELEAKLTDEQYEQFYFWISHLTPLGRMVSASAFQRASALLLTFHPELEP